MLSKQEKEQLRTLLVEVVLEVRQQYLWGPSPNVPKHWEQLHGRMKQAARTTQTAEEWASRFTRGMGVQALTSQGSQALIDLVHFVTEQDATLEFFGTLDREHSYLIALARLTADNRSQERKDHENAPI